MVKTEIGRSITNMIMPKIVVLSNTSVTLKGIVDKLHEDRDEDKEIIRARLNTTIVHLENIITTIDNVLEIEREDDSGSVLNVHKPSNI